MCGIAGSVNFKLHYPDINGVMLHRGPDEQAGFAIDNVDLYHLRLSILDISGGKQPMHLDDRYSIIFNGEIYNHNEIRQQLGLQGSTASDTETLLLLYRKLGPAMLHYLDGMFAFALYDKAAQQLFIARDRAGKKPLYYFNDGNKIVFASELNCLKRLLPLQMDSNHIYHYLRLGSFYRACTPYQQVNELPGGSYLLINCNSLQVQEKRWWDIAAFYNKKSTDSFETALATTEAMLDAGVKRRLESSDLEVGCFLSGGIDSGLVTAMASKYNSRLKTYTISFEVEYDEAPLAKLVADKYHTQHTPIQISFDNLRNDVEQILANYGEPFFDSSAIPSYYVSAAAKKHLTVILNGDGADELFGGYRRYVPFAQYDFFKANAFLKGPAMLAKKLLPPPSNKKSTYNYLYRLAALASKSSLDIYLAAGVDIFEDYEKYFRHTPEGYLQQAVADFSRVATSNLSGLQKIMLLDFDTNLFNDLLVKMDIATMAHSLEGRSPMLCKELLEYIPGISDNYKIKGRQTKYLLRQLAKKYLPPTLIHQPKRGFEIPLKQWVNQQLSEPIHSYLSAPGSVCSNFVEHRFITGLLNNTIKVPAEKRAKILWTLFSLEVWYRKVYLSS
jgi:asparagine synthase (glutamine-hydrolysing)